MQKIFSNKQSMFAANTKIYLNSSPWYDKVARRQSSLKNYTNKKHQILTFSYALVNKSLGSNTAASLGKLRP